jgi:hypothetical protein
VESGTQKQQREYFLRPADGCDSQRTR